MNTKTTTLACLLILAATAASAFAAPDLTDIEKRIERASLRADLESANAIAAELDAALAQDAKSPALLYLRGYTAYATASGYRGKKDNAAVLAELEKADKVLGLVRGKSPWTAEAAAIESSVCGQIIGLKGGASAMTLGPKSGDLLAQATSDAPNSPRVLMFRGISKVTTPAQWGGNPAEGMRLLQQSVVAFEKRDAASPGPRWGQAEALAWLGFAKQKSGDIEAARGAWTKALELEPEYAWVKYALLPSLAAGKVPTS